MFERSIDEIHIGNLPFVKSYFEINEKTGRFHGTLDIKALGGAGFASQRTTGEDREWDLSDYVGIQLNTSKGDST